jgi:glycosyltransferase involved in cell wall biosynthesis
MNEQSDYREISDLTVMAVQPLVSVHMLAYRHERFLAEAIEGVIAQICDFPIELLIAEDCSPDGTLAIALDYQRRYPHLIRVITGDKNVGMHANSGRSVPAARGKYIAFCEGDDCWHHPRKLQMQLTLMTANPDMVFCHTDFDRRTRIKTSRRMHRTHPTQWLAKGNAYLSLLYEWSVMTATAMYRKDILDAYSTTEFNNAGWPFCDRNASLYASLKGSVGYIDESTATYRKVRNSAMNSGVASYLRMPTAAAECIDLFMKRYPVDEADRRKITARLKVNIYRSAFFAERLDLMQSAFDWLSANGFHRSRLGHRLRCTAVKLKFPVRLLRATKNFVDLYVSSIPS